MALTRKFLTALGIEDAKVEEIISAHTEVTDSLKEERDKFKTDAGKYAEAKAELDRIKAEAAKDGGKNPFEDKYNALKEEFDKFKEENNAKAAHAKKESAYKAILKEAGVADKRIDSVLKVSDLSKIEFGEDGKIKGKENILEQIKKDWDDFIPEKGTVGVPEMNPPSSEGEKKLSPDAVEAAKIFAELHAAQYGEIKQPAKEG